MSEQEQEQRQHHPWSPSSLQYREACPCFKNRDVVHIRAVAGTKAHGVVESGADDNTLSDEDTMAAAECLDFIEYRRKFLQQEAIDAMVKEKTPLPSAFEVKELKEDYLPVDDLVFPDCQSTTAGYVDHVLINYNRTYAEVIDWKFGAWEVEKADNNLQGIAYSLGVFYKFPTVERIRVFFKQPLIGSTSEAVFTRDQIPALYLRVSTVVARARAAKAAGTFETATPTVPVCNFCDNLGVCPKVAALACRVAKKFHPLAFPDEINPSLLLSPGMTKQCMLLAQVVEIWAGAVKRQVSDKVLRGSMEMPEGYGLQTMRRREVCDKKKFKEVALRYVSPEVLDEAADIPFGAIESAISDAAPRGQKTAAVKQFGDELISAGAAKLGDEFSFLRVKSGKNKE